MRNLKKILALVLALVMSLSVMSIASAESKFTDRDVINDKYVDAVEVLGGIGIFTGYEDGTFNPEGSITRKEVAALIYRIDTGDLSKDGSKIWAEGGDFDDVTADKWYAGYVNYCAGSGIIKGYEDGTFRPDANVTGYEVLTMILRVVGYDKNNEFTGPKWRDNVFNQARELKILTNIAAGDTLGGNASRQLVAELLFRTIKDVPQVKYNLVTGYIDNNGVWGEGNVKNDTVGFERFGLGKNRENKTGPWGDPYSAWFYNKGEVPGTRRDVTPLETFDYEKDHCAIFDIIGETDLESIAKYVNGVQGESIKIVHDKSKTEGARGTTMRIYEDRIVLVETYLAKVVKAADDKKDSSGHVVEPAYNNVNVYAVEGEFKATHKSLTFVEGENPYYRVVFEGNNYAKGTYLLVNVNNKTGAVEVIDKANEVKGAVEPFQGKQTFIWTRTDRHSVGGKDYYDNDNYVLDVAKNDKNGVYNWILDKSNNVIGSDDYSVPAAEKTYVVVHGAYWQIPNDGTKASCQAYVQKMDGSYEWVTITHVDNIKMKYARTMPSNFDEETGLPVYDETFNFHKGYVFDTFQYNLKTALHLYQLVDGKLTTVKAHMDEATIKNKYPIVTGKTGEENVTFFVDNNTTYVYYNADKMELTFVKGYANQGKDFTGLNVDYVMNAENDTFAQFIYIYGIKAEGTQTPGVKDPVHEDKFVFFTTDATGFDLSAETITLLNCVDKDGAVELTFKADQFGSVEATYEALYEMVEQYAGTLCKVHFVDGIVTSVEPVDRTDKTCNETVNKKTVTYTANFVDNYYFINTGVLVVNTADGKQLPLNSNENSLIIKQDGQAVRFTEAEAQDLINFYMNEDNDEKANVYVVYDANNMIKALFITDKTQPVDADDVSAEMMAIMFNKAHAANMALTGNFTYAVTADTTAAMIEADSAALIAAMQKAGEESNFYTAFELMGVDVALEVAVKDFKDAKDADGNAVVTATVTFKFTYNKTGVKTFSQEITITKNAK